MKGQLFLGIDVGTTAVKAAVFDRHGAVQAIASIDAQSSHPASNLSEQDMDEVWQNVRSAITEVTSVTDARSVASIGVCGQGDGLWALDASHKPVRPAILWNDQRASRYVQQWVEDGTSDLISRHCRTAIWSGTSAAAYRWLADNEPETASKVAHICHAKDWINLNLTGSLATDFTDASIPFLDLESVTFSDETFRLGRVEALRGKMPPPRRSDTKLGTLDPKIASELGLTEDIPVAVGAIDLAAMHIGLGLNKVGDTLLILGTTAVVNTVTEPQPFDQPPVGATILHPLSDRWIRVLAPQSGASAFDWFADLHPDGFGGQTAGDIAEKINSAAQTVPPGSDGVLFLPYLTGERAPFVAPQASGAFLGLRSGTSRASMARAVMEGTAFSLRHCLDETGISAPREIAITGGGARNDLWCSILASVLGTAVVATEEADHGLWGAALLGAGAAGQLDPYTDHPRQTSRRRHETNSKWTKHYDVAYRRYRSAIEIHAPFWKITQDET
ncbi:MAG: carbohydrate kinase [Alphaproteobacteria bacterium]|nr:carbohydrate kinase [Alphaproteobacteria bacterium]